MLVIEVNRPVCMTLTLNYIARWIAQYFFEHGFVVLAIVCDLSCVDYHLRFDNIFSTDLPGIKYGPLIENLYDYFAQMIEEDFFNQST
jgi:hypothetical protein